MQKWVCSSTLQLLHLLLCHGHPYPCWFTALVEREEVFGEGHYGTSGFNSRGGKQNFHGEECVWKRVAKDGKHYRIIQHSTGYFYQQGLLPSDTAEPADEEEEINEDKDGEGDDDELEEEKDEEEEEEAEPPSKKKKGGKGAKAPAKVPKAAKAPKASPKASPKRASKRGHKYRARDTYPRMYPYVSNMYRECILCEG